jgi:hypothetical protein
VKTIVEIYPILYMEHKENAVREQKKKVSKSTPQDKG